MKRMFLCFNHELTREQIQDAKRNLNIDEFIHLPSRLKKLWQNIPPDLLDISSYLKPIIDWLKTTTREGDLILVQGDFGATYLIVQFAFKEGLIPVYATTKREVIEKKMPDGKVEMIHQFRHVIFRRYRQLP